MKKLLLLLFLCLLFTFTFSVLFAQNKSTNIKPPKDFAGKLMFYEQLLHQEWDFEENIEEKKLKQERIKLQKDAIFINNFFLSLVRFVNKQQAELTKKIDFFEKQRQDSLAKINGIDDQALEKNLREIHTFRESSKLFEERKIAFEKRKKTLEESKTPKFVYRRDTNALVFEYDPLLEPYYISHVFEQDSNGTKRHESREYFLEDENVDKILSNINEKINKDSNNEDEDYHFVPLSHNKKIFNVDSSQRNIKIIEEERPKSKFNYESLYFKKDSIIIGRRSFHKNHKFHAKCRFVLIQGKNTKQGKKYLDLHYGDSPLNFHRIEILEITKEKLVFGVCDNPDFTKLNHCVYHSRNFLDRQKMKELELEFRKRH